MDFVGKLSIKDGPSTPSTSSGTEGSGTLSYIYFACTCGDECGLAEDIFRKALEQKGWNLNACFSVQMPETYIGMPGFKLDTDENAQRKIAAADKLMNDCILRLQNKESFSKMTKGGAAWFKSRLINPRCVWAVTTIVPSMPSNTAMLR